MAKKMMIAAIEPSPGGFGEWQVSPYTSRVNTVSEAVRVLTDYASDQATPVANLDGDADIRGLIHNEPARVYAYETDAGDYAYFGVLS